MRFPGGKGKTFQQLINLMPPHDTYIEPFLGGGAVLRNKRLADRTFAIDLDERVLTAFAEMRLPGVNLIRRDAVAFLQEFPYDGNELVYADPPYLPETRRRPHIYRHEYSAADHLRLLETLRALPCKVLISGYDSDLYQALLKGWRKTSFQAMSHVGLREECVWMNFDEPQTLHDGRYLGADFRERQQVKRRQNALRRRVESMPPAERSEFLRWLLENYSDSLRDVPCKALA